MQTTLESADFTDVTLVSEHISLSISLEDFTDVTLADDHDDQDDHDYQ